MSQEKKSGNPALPFAMNRASYILLIVGVALNIIGFLLMIGGGSEDKTVFLEEEIFSHQRITIAPILVIVGYVVILYAIMKKNKNVTPNE
jgi:hypothetical protein